MALVTAQFPIGQICFRRNVLIGGKSLPVKNKIEGILFSSVERKLPGRSVCRAQKLSAPHATQFFFACACVCCRVARGRGRRTRFAERETSGGRLRAVLVWRKGEDSVLRRGRLGTLQCACRRVWYGAGKTEYVRVVGTVDFLGAGLFFFVFLVVLIFFGFFARCSFVWRITLSTVENCS